MPKIGVVPYLNALPLCRYLSHPVTFGTPVELDRQMSDESLDIALLPVLSLFKNPHYTPLFNAGLIQSAGPVESVVLFYKKKLSHPKQIQSVRLSTESKTSIALFKIICTYLWKRDSSQLMGAHSDPDAVFEIGDRALFFDDSDYQQCDLGQVWTEWTGLPFIYACWVSREKPSQEIIDTLTKAKEEGLKKIEEIVRETRDLPPERLKRYLTQSIQYEIRSDSLKGLELFKEYCLKLGLI